MILIDGINPTPTDLQYPTTSSTILSITPTTLQSIRPSTPIQSTEPTDLPTIEPSVYMMNNEKMPKSEQASVANCFSGSSKLTLSTGSLKDISQATVGDRILSYSTKDNVFRFSRIVAIPHEKNKKVASFNMISTEEGYSIKLTSEHLIQSGSCTSSLQLIFAKTVKVGDCVMSIKGLKIK